MKFDFSIFLNWLYAVAAAATITAAAENLCLIEMFFLYVYRRKRERSTELVYIGKTKWMAQQLEASECVKTKTEEEQH